MNWFSNFWNNLTQPVTWNSNNTNSGNSSSLYSPVAQSTQNMSYGTPNVSTYGGTQAQANQTSSLLTDKINQFKPVQTMSYGQNMSYGKPTFTSTTSGSLNNTLNTSTNNTDYGSGYNSLYTPQTYPQTDYQQENNTQTSTQNNQNQVNTSSNTNTGADLLNSLKPAQQNNTGSIAGQNALDTLNFTSEKLKQYYSNDEVYNNELAQINAQFQNLKNQQMQENSYREEAARQQGITSGLAFSTPGVYSSEVNTIVDTGLSKLSELTSKQNQLVLQAKNQDMLSKKQTLMELSDTAAKKYDVALKMNEELYKTQQRHEEQINNQINDNLPAVYDYINKLPEDQKMGYINQVSSTLGVPVTKFMSAYRNFDMQENNNIRDMYKTIANNVAKENPQLALEIMQKSMTPQGRQELLSSPYFKTMSSVANFGNAIGGYKQNIVTDVNDAMERVAGIETGGRANPYATRSDKPTIRTRKDGTKYNDYAYGKYQVMGDNIPSWTKEVLGKSMTIQEFLNNPEAQDIVASSKLQDAYNKYGTWEDAASVWFSGKPLANNVAKDVYGTSVPSYIKKFLGINNNQQIQTQDYSTLANSVASILYKSDNKKRNAFIENVLSSPTPTEAVYGAINEELVNRKSNVLLSDVDTNLDQLQSLNDLMAQYYARGGETSWLKGKRSKIENRFGTTSDAELAALGTSILDTIIQYRKVTTGTAFSEKEKIDIDSIFPGIGKDKNLNDAIIKRRITDVNNKKASLISQVIGKNLANQFYNSNQSQVGGSGNINWDNYGL